MIGRLRGRLALSPERRYWSLVGHALRMAMGGGGSGGGGSGYSPPSSNNLTFDFTDGGYAAPNTQTVNFNF